MIEFGNLRKGDYVVYNNELYKVEGIQSVVVSRHAHTKTKLALTSVFRGEKRTLTLPSSEKIEKVDITRRHGQFIAKLGEDMGQVMDLRDYDIYDARIPESLKGKVKEGSEITFIEFRESAQIIELREE